MLEGLAKRIQFHRRTFRVLWVPVIIIWTIFSNAATIRDNFLSPYWQQKLATLNLLPKWHWYVWVIGTLIIVILALIEGSYRAAQTQTKKVPKDVIVGPLAAGQSALPEYRPRVLPCDYGRDEARGSFGLSLVNPGYMALEVQIPSIAVGNSMYTLIFPERLAQLGERDHRRFIEAWLEHPTLPGKDGGQLHEVMRMANVEVINFGILYQDTDFRWYRTNCVIERTQRARNGLEVRATGQELIPEPIQVSALPQAGSKRKDLPSATIKLTGPSRSPHIEVTNNGSAADFYARMEIAGSVNGPTRDVFAKWAHTDTIRSRIARGDTCRLRIAELQSRNDGFLTWKFFAVQKDNKIIEFRAFTSSCAVSTPIIQAEPILVRISVIAEPDLENGIQVLEVVLGAFGAEMEPGARV